MAFRAKRRVILLADDEVLIRNLVRISLDAAGFHVLAASDGLEALALSRTYPEHIDVLLTDVDMPNLDGLSLAERVKLERPDIRVLVMSGRLSSPVHVHDAEVKLLPKPFSPQALVRIIREFFVSASP
jgi:DNA-binding response OmpR family regulator